MSNLGKSGSLEGEVAIVTGAGSGIGRACAEVLARAGSTVVATDINEELVVAAAKEIAAAGLSCVAYAHDVSQEGDWQSIVDDVQKRLGPVGILVNNAGYKASVAPKDRGLLDLDLETWDRMMKVNLYGPMLGSRAVLPSMIDRGHGSIIMISSVSSMYCHPRMATAYTASKAGLNGLVRSIATSYGTMGVRCNGIAPGTIIVDETSEAQKGFRESVEGLIARVGRPSDIAGCVAYLASESAEFINGQILIVDGGWVAHLPGQSPNARK